MVDRRNPAPLWSQLLSTLTQRIENGEFRDHFPTDKELMETYKVSRQTVREAVRRLEQDGMLTRQRGKGTTLIKTEFTQTLGTLYSLFNEVESTGAVQKSIILAQEIIKKPEIALELQLEPTEELFFLKRIRLANEIPLAIDHAYLPANKTKALMEVNFEHTALYVELEKRSNLRPIYGHEDIIAVIPSVSEKETLEIGDGVGAFEIRRKSFSSDGPLEWRSTLIRGDRYSFSSNWQNTHDGRNNQTLKVEFSETNIRT